MKDIGTTIAKITFVRAMVIPSPSRLSGNKQFIFLQ